MEPEITFETDDASTKSANERIKPVPYWRLFHYADVFDVVMILVAIVLSILAGAAITLESFLAGQLFNIFISYNAAEQFSDFTLNITNFTCTPNSVRQLLAVATNDSNRIFCDAFQQGNVLNSASEFACDPDQTLIDEATTFSLYFVYVAVGTFVTHFIAHILWTVSASRQSKRMRIAFYRSVLQHEIGWFETKDTSQLEPLFLKGIENIQAGIGTQAGVLINDITIFLVGIVWAFFINWKLAFVVFTLLPIVSVLGGLSFSITKKSKEKEESAYLKAGSVATEVLSSIRTVLAFGAEHKEDKRYERHAKEAELQAIKGGFFYSFFSGAVFFVSLSAFGVAFWYGSVLLVNCEIEGGDILTVISLILAGAFSLGGVLLQVGTFISASSSAAAVFEVIEEGNILKTRDYCSDGASNDQWYIDKLTEVPQTPAQRLRPNACDGKIEFSGVHFSYPARPQTEILHEFNFIIEPGQTVAIVGPSGNGKSTILQLIQQLYIPKCGQIMIDGTRTQDLDAAWLHSNVGVVTQEPIMFNTSIRENILLAKSDATQEELEAVATTANAHSFIMELPDGYDTYVGEGGIQLSGGQKQRIAIARALIRNPKILLLDEATSALDTQSERLVQSALEKAGEGRTTLIVAHRLSTVKNADKIICIKNGQIEEAGNHTELILKQGLYAELARNQLKDDILSHESNSKGFKRRNFSVQSRNTKRRHLQKVKLLRKIHSTHHSGWLNYIENFPKDQNASTDKLVDKGPSQRISTLSHLWRFVRPDWVIVLTGVVLYGIIGATYPIIGALLANVNALFSESDRDAIIELSRNISLGSIGLAFAAGGFYFAGSFVVTLSGERLTTRLRVQLFKSLLQKDVGWYDEEEHTTGALTTILSVDANNVKKGTGIQLGSILLAVTSVLTALAVCFYSSWELSLILLLAFPLVFLSYRISIKLYQSTGSGDDDHLQASAHVVIESVDHIKTVVTLGAEEYFVNSINNYLRSHTWSSIKKSFLVAFGIAFTRAVLLCVYAAGWRLAAFLITEERIGLLEVFRVFAAVIITARSVTSALSTTSETSEAYESGRNVFAMIKDSNNSPLQQSEDKKLDAVFGHISGRDVYFHYPCRPDVKVLRGLNISVSPGETLALVGSSGSGKSTIVSLIERFYQPSVGVVTLDGQNIAGLDLKWLRSQIGYVPQEPVLFNTTIADNIRYGALFREVSDEEIVEVAKACNIHDFIQSLPLGYSTVVGSGGSFLSGGQKQRIAIARALVRNPKILLLDEATSSLDAESEQAVQQTLKTARVGRTSIVVAHRLSTIRDADCIAVVCEGQIVESGTHATLMSRRGAYYNLVKAVSL